MLNRCYCLAKLLMKMDDIMTAQEEKFVGKELNNLLNLSFNSVFILFKVCDYFLIFNLKFKFIY